MRALRSTVLLVAVLIGLAGQLRAQPAARSLSDYTVTTWNENDGLPAGRIRAIEQDGDGYLWLATDSGLVRFDGVRFGAWGALGETRLPVGSVTALMSARDQSLWVGVSGQSPIARLENGKVTLYGERDGLVPALVLSILEDHNGVVWAATLQGLFRFAEGRWHRLGEADGLPRGSVLAVVEDRAKRLWAATSTAVFRKDRGLDPFEQVDVIAISSNVWQSFSEDSTGTMWMSDLKEGFRAPAAPRRRPGPPHRGWGVHLLHDRRGNLWVGTQGQGLWRIREPHGKAEPSIDVITIDDGLANNGVQSLLEDREGNVWVGTVAGLQRLSPHRVAPVKNLAVPRAIERTPDGSVWVGTAGALVRFTAKGRRDYTEADGVPGAVVLALHTDERGDLWISTERGVARFSHERFSPLLLSPSSRMQRILGITGADGSLWLRDFYLRLFRWRNGELTLATDVPEAHSRAASSIYAGRSGNLWIGSSRGRLGVRYRNGGFRAYDLDIGDIVSVFEDSRGAVWVGGNNGLSYGVEGRFVTVNRRNGFAGGVKSFIEDDLGFMWIGSDSGFLRMERGEVDRVAKDGNHQLRYRFFNTADGVAGVPFSEGSPSALRTADGRLWFTASSGVTIVDPRSLGDSPPPPPVRIEALTADSRGFDPSSSPQLPARTSHLQIAFTALTLSDPMRARFRYRLEGFDREWVEAGAARLASYTNLPPRRYVFRVIASTGDGTFGEPGATLEFGIAPTFYQTPAFFIACGLAVFLTVYASWRIHVRQVRRQFALVLAERIRMGRAIHDTLLQGLAALALQVDDLSHDADLSSPSGRRRILRIREQVEDYIRQARRSILDLRTPSLATRDLPQALRDAAQRAIGGRDVELDVTVTGTPPSCSPSVEEQLVLIGQEAVNNAVQHGQARRVTVELDYADDRTRLRVIDDGCGFDPESAPQATGHYGLISMRERAEQVRGRTTIASTPGSGTKVETIVPT